jgi:CDGSH-type Zn-finger protein
MDDPIRKRQRRLVPPELRSVLEDSMTDTTIQVAAHGPLRVTGNFCITDPTGASFDLAGRTTISLCRCGQSQNKPFCDGAHGKTGFRSEEQARALPPPKPKI